jgi:hypothetical protein
MSVAIQSRIDKIDGFYLSLKSSEKKLIDEIESIKNEIDVLSKVSQVFKHLLDRLVRDEINKMAGLVTYGLKAAFEDQDLSFKPVIEKKNDRIYITLKTINKDHEGMFGSFGGSVAVIESFLLRIVCMIKLNLARFIILDETFGPIGDEGTDYIYSTSRFVGELCTKLNLDLLLVTQHAGFSAFADRVYKLKDSPHGVIIEREK